MVSKYVFHGRKVKNICLINLITKGEIQEKESTSFPLDWLFFSCRLNFYIQELSNIQPCCDVIESQESGLPSISSNLGKNLSSFNW